mgnify:CR=1 FL=1
MPKNAFEVEMKTQSGLMSADLNGDGHVTDEEIDRQRKILEIQDEDAMRDAQRKMAWFALFVTLSICCCSSCITGTERSRKHTWKYGICVLRFSRSNCSSILWRQCLR